MNFEGFLYLDVDDPIVAWNTYRGVLISQKLTERGMFREIPRSVSMTVARMLMNKSWERYEFEQELENYRTSFFPNRVSRFTGLYVFDTPEAALAAADAWGEHINHANLTDVGASASRNKTRVDANWITWMLAERKTHNPEWRLGIHRYWSGEPCRFYLEPIWEVLLDGALTIWGVQLRERAYNIIKEQSPMSLALLEQARLAAMLGSDLGHISALITFEKERHLMSFHIDMWDAQNVEYTDRLRNYIATHPELVNHRDLTIGGDTFAPPNFVAYSHVFDSQRREGFSIPTAK